MHIDSTAYNGMSSIRELTKAGSGREGSVSLMRVKGCRGGKNYKLSSEGRSLGEYATRCGYELAVRYDLRP